MAKMPTRTLEIGICDIHLTKLFVFNLWASSKITNDSVSKLMGNQHIDSHQKDCVVPTAMCGGSEVISQTAQHDRPSKNGPSARMSCTV